MKVKLSAFRLLALIALLCFVVPVQAAENASDDPPLSLEQIVEMAIAANISIKSSKEDINAALATKKQSRTGFLPTFNATYQYRRNDEETFVTEVISSLDSYDFAA